MSTHLPPWLANSAGAGAGAGSGAGPAPLAEVPTDARAREVFEQVFAHTPAAICVLRGPTHRFVYLNAAYQQLFPDRTLLGCTVADALPETVAGGFVALLDTVYRTGETYFGHEQRMLLVPPGGGPAREQFFTFTYQAYREQGAIVGISTFAYEVGEQVAARRAQESSEASAIRLRVLTDALPVLIGYVDHEHRYRFTNHAYEAWFGQPAAALPGQLVREVVGEAAYLGVLPYFERALAGERVDFEARMPYRADFVKHIRTSFVPDVQAGRVAGFYSLVTDVTREVEARQQVLALNQQLAAVNHKLYAANEALAEANRVVATKNAITYCKTVY